MRMHSRVQIDPARSKQHSSGSICWASPATNTIGQLNMCLCHWTCAFTVSSTCCWINEYSSSEGCVPTRSGKYQLGRIPVRDSRMRWRDWIRFWDGMFNVARIIHEYYTHHKCWASINTPENMYRNSKHTLSWNGKRTRIRYIVESISFLC